MIFALDFDGTYTADPELWETWGLHAINKGHTVLCISFRSDHEMEDVKNTIGSVIGSDNCFATNAIHKKEFIEEKGIHVDVWIDDIPETIVREDHVIHWHTNVKYK
jgi:hypothetical protein